MIRAPLLAVVSLAAACTTMVPMTGNPLAGSWVGEQINVTVDADGKGMVDLPCASATFEAPQSLDSGGHFLTTGRYSRGTGVATLDPPQSVAANVSGRLDRGGVLWLDVATNDSYPVRTVTLRRGPPGKMIRCL